MHKKPDDLFTLQKKLDQESSAFLKYPVAMVLSGICHYYELAKLHLRNDIVREPYGNRDKKQSIIADQNAHIYIFRKNPFLLIVLYFFVILSKLSNLNAKEQMMSVLDGWKYPTNVKDIIAIYYNWKISRWCFYFYFTSENYIDTYKNERKKYFQNCCYIQQIIIRIGWPWKSFLINALSFYVMYDFNSKKRLNRKKSKKGIFHFSLD